VLAAANTFVLLGQALRTALTAEHPVLHAAVTDAAQREWSAPSGLSVARALDRLEEEANALADAIERVEPAGWKRTAKVAGGGEIGTFDIVRQAVQAGADHLRGATEAVAAARAGRR
jgi:hypothetical protein